MKKLSQAPEKANSSNEASQIVLPEMVVPVDWRGATNKFQRRFLRAVLALHKGNKTHAAEALGIARRTIQLQLHPQD